MVLAEMDINISVAYLLWIIGGITAAIAFGKMAMKPFNEIDDHERRITKLEKGRDERTETDRLILKCLNALINHSIDGNDVDDLKAVRDEMQNTIIDHHK